MQMKSEEEEEKRSVVPSLRLTLSSLVAVGLLPLRDTERERERREREERERREHV